MTETSKKRKTMVPVETILQRYDYAVLKSGQGVGIGIVSNRELLPEFL